MAKILALDIATKTGWATDGLSGVQTFPLNRGESPGMRLLRFRRWLRETIAMVKPGVIAYEQAHHRGGAATALALHFQGEMLAAAAEFGSETLPVHSATLKKYATGSGRAEKQQMIDEARRRGFDPKDDNEADACLIWCWAMEQV